MHCDGLGRFCRSWKSLPWMFTFRHCRFPSVFPGGQACLWWSLFLFFLSNWTSRIPSFLLVSLCWVQRCGPEVHLQFQFLLKAVI